MIWKLKPAAPNRRERLFGDAATVLLVAGGLAWPKALFPVVVVAAAAVTALLRLAGLA
jgi:hypothetical protein